MTYALIDSKIQNKQFWNDFLLTVEKLQNKKVLLYGAGLAFDRINKFYNLPEKLNIVAIADKKFELNNPHSFFGIKSIKPNNISKEDYDVILITDECSDVTFNILIKQLSVPAEKIEMIFQSSIKDEQMNLSYLYKCGFEKKFAKLVHRLKNKKIMLYGAGSYLEVICKYFDIKNLDIIGISDTKYSDTPEKGYFLGYKMYSPDEIENSETDCILISTKNYLNIFEYLDKKFSGNTKIKILPLIEKPLLLQLKEIM